MRPEQPIVASPATCTILSEMLGNTTLQGGYLLALSLSEDDRNFDDKADILDINGFGETWQVLRATRSSWRCHFAAACGTCHTPATLSTTL